MNTYLTIFVASLVSSLFLTPVVRRLAQRCGWLDVPADGRRVHSAPVPRLGGVAVFCSFAFALAVIPIVDNLVTHALVEHWREATAVLASSTLVFLFGVFDDLKGAAAKWKFVVQGLAGVVLFSLGGRIGALTVPFVGSFDLPPILNFIFTIAWVVGVTNAFNLIDGLDGLAAGGSRFPALVMLAAPLLNGNRLVTVITLALAGRLLRFRRRDLN